VPEPRRVVVNASNVSMAVDGEADWVVIPLQKHSVRYVRSLDPAAESDGWVNHIAEVLRASLSREIGFVPSQVKYGTEDEECSFSIPPRWWDLPRRLGLRGRKRVVLPYRVYYATCYTARWHDPVRLQEYEFERRVSE